MKLTDDEKVESTTYSFVIPVHNEEDVLDTLFDELDRVRAMLDGTSEVVFVDDGSSDNSWSMLTAYTQRDRSATIVRLSRNFGHQIAVTCGLDNTCGDAVVIMDADLQDPPDLVLEMSRRWREGYHVVYGVRTDRRTDTRFKRATADAYYKLLNSLSSVDIPAQVGDFRMIDRAVVDAIGQMPERNRYVRGMFAWLGYRQIGVEYRRPERAAGTTSYSLKKMVSLASDGVIGFSKAPIRLITFAGVATVAIAAISAVATTASSLVRPGRSVGAPTTTTIATGLAGVQLIAIGVIGEYVGRIFDETLDRPLYATQEVRRRSDIGATADDRHDDQLDNVRAIVALFDRSGTASDASTSNGRTNDSVTTDTESFPTRLVQSGR